MKTLGRIAAVPDVRPRSQRRHQLLAALLVSGVVGILAAIAVPLYANIWARTHTAKVMADTRAIEGAIVAYASQIGRLPGSLEDLTRAAVSDTGEAVGPFLRVVPKHYDGGAYRYEITADGKFRVTGDAHGHLIEVGTGVTSTRWWRLVANGLDAWVQVLGRWYEGHVAKGEERFYVGGRTRAWLKVKVPGWTDTDLDSFRIAKSDITSSSAASSSITHRRNVAPQQQPTLSM